METHQRAMDGRRLFTAESQAYPPSCLLAPKIRWNQSCTGIAGLNMASHRCPSGSMK